MYDVTSVRTIALSSAVLFLSSFTSATAANDQLTCIQAEADAEGPGAAAQQNGPVLDGTAAALNQSFASCRAIDIGDVHIGPGDLSTLRAFYERRNFAPIWTDADGASAALTAFQDQARLAEEDLLDPANYDIQTLVDDLDADSAEGRAAIELAASHVFVEYALDVRQGSLGSEMTFTSDAVAPRDVSYRSVLDRIGRDYSLETSVREWRDLNPVYVKLREGLKKFRAEASAREETRIPDGDLLKPGERDSRVPMLRERLGLPSPVNEADRELYDEQLSDAVKAFQKERGLATDGLLGPNTLEILNTTDTDRIRIAEINMERARWLPRDLGERFVLVDVPGFHARLYENGEEVKALRTIVGEEYNRTPPFADRIEYMELNPYWNVPNSILSEEIAPKMLENPNYLAENNMEVLSGWSADARVLDPSRVNWSAAAGGNPTFRVRQRPGPGNALGQIKFMFPNRYSIYLHDTPAKELFEENRRTFSHGCIRVQNPMEVAEFLLETTEGVTVSDVKAKIEAGTHDRVSLGRKVPVYITYFTAWPAADGSLEFRPDIYNRDEEMLQQLAG